MSESIEEGGTRVASEGVAMGWVLRLCYVVVSVWIWAMEGLYVLTFHHVSDNDAALRAEGTCP